jgi:mono/diheme cytochrome c family protein
MKHCYFTIGAGTILLLFGSCANKDKPITEVPAIVDSIAQSNADSVRLASVWLKFSYAERRGKRVFDQYCVICHGQHGEGDGFNAYNLDPKPHTLTDSAYVGAFSDASLSQLIAFGGRGVNKSVLMPAYGSTLKSDQISYLVSYLRVLAHNMKRDSEP